jgi:hypothetical protein
VVNKVNPCKLKLQVSGRDLTPWAQRPLRRQWEDGGSGNASLWQLVSDEPMHKADIHDHANTGSTTW